MEELYCLYQIATNENTENMLDRWIVLSEKTQNVAEWKMKWEQCKSNEPDNAKPWTAVWKITNLACEEE